MHWVGWSGPLARTYISHTVPEDPQSEVTPLTVPVSARSKLTGRLGGPLRRGATFGALALCAAAPSEGKEEWPTEDL